MWDLFGLIRTFLQVLNETLLRVKKKKEGALASLFRLISRLDLAALLALSPVIIQLVSGKLNLTARTARPPWSYVARTRPVFAVETSLILWLLFFVLIVDCPSREFVQPFQQIVLWAPRAIKAEIRHPSLSLGNRGYCWVPLAPGVLDHPVIIPGFEPAKIIGFKSLWI